MEIPQASNHEQVPAEQPLQEREQAPQEDEVLAWEPLGNDLWLPHRIRGSWRGGVLG